MICILVAAFKYEQKTDTKKSRLACLQQNYHSLCDKNLIPFGFKMAK